MRLSLAAGTAFLALAYGATNITDSHGKACRCFPGDACWPSPTAWSALNTTVGGRLIATVPIGTPCHGSTYNAAACLALQNNWDEPQTQYVSAPLTLRDVDCIICFLSFVVVFHALALLTRKQ